jgi:hypothetical protein
MRFLNLHRVHAVLPEGEVRGHTILAVVNEDEHALSGGDIVILVIAHVEIVLLDVGEDLLGVGLGLGLEFGDLILRLALLGHVGSNVLHVLAEVTKVVLLVVLAEVDACRLYKSSRACRAGVVTVL